MATRSRRARRLARRCRTVTPRGYIHAVIYAASQEACWWIVGSRVSHDEMDRAHVEVERPVLAVADAATACGDAASARIWEEVARAST